MTKNKMPHSARLYRLLVLNLIIIAAAASAQSQCTQKFSELPAAPELFGFHLGMTKAEVKARIPQTVFGRTDAFGVSKTTINPFFDPKIDNTKFESVRSISLDMVDDHLSSLWIGFDETFRVQTIDGFVKLISEALKIQGEWSSWKSRGQQIKCTDFQLIVSTVAGGPSLRILDIGAEEVVAARRQAKEEQDSTTEAAAQAAQNAGADVLGDKQAKIYYLSNCAPPKEILEVNKIIFNSTEDAEKAGYKLAKSCH
jgi:hypothetical protein